WASCTSARSPTPTATCGRRCGWTRPRFPPAEPRPPAAAPRVTPAWRTARHVLRRLAKGRARTDGHGARRTSVWYAAGDESPAAGTAAASCTTVRHGGATAGGRIEGRPAMTILVIGLVVFMALRALPWLRGARASLVGSLGEGPYKGLYSLASAVGLVLIIWGYAVADQVPVYDPPAWGRHLAMLLVLLAFVALAVYLHKGRLRLWLRHPMLIAVALWAT